MVSQHSDFMQDHHCFKDKLVIITGAAAGIGMAAAEAFAARGANLALIDIDKNLPEFAAKLGPQHQSFIVDVKDETALVASIEAIVKKYGQIDIMLNNAGIGPLAPAEDYPTHLWDNTLNINLRAAFICARECAKTMIKQKYGRIINMASQAAIVGIEGHVAYCASKAGIIGMTHCMAMEWGKFGITVNALSPTVVETALGLSGWAGEKGVKARAEIPVGRFGQPFEIVDSLLFLASPYAAMINGANLVIDGGFTIR